LTAAGLLTAGLLITPTLIAILRRFPWLLACTRLTSLALTRFVLPTGLLITAALIAPGLSRLTGLILTGLLLVTCLTTRTGLASTARTTRFLTRSRLPSLGRIATVSPTSRFLRATCLRRVIALWAIRLLSRIRLARLVPLRLLRTAGLGITLPLVAAHRLIRLLPRIRLARLVPLRLLRTACLGITLPLLAAHRLIRLLSRIRLAGLILGRLLLCVYIASTALVGRLRLIFGLPGR
jgi:hypothetical protein